MRIVLITLSTAALFALGACGENQSAEKAGENMDSQLEETFTGETNSNDGAFERAGEAVDNATGHENTDPVDAASDATDGDPATRP
jgi:hypothetical protein